MLGDRLELNSFFASSRSILQWPTRSERDLYITEAMLQMPLKLLQQLNGFQIRFLFLTVELYCYVYLHAFVTNMQQIHGVQIRDFPSL